MANFGKMNFWFARLLSQGGRITQPMNFLMLIFLTAQEQPLAWLLIPIGVIFSGVWVWFDVKKVAGAELTEWFDRNPRFTKMQNDIEEIKCQLKKQ